jgi:hypothetical protein
MLVSQLSLLWSGPLAARLVAEVADFAGTLCGLVEIGVCVGAISDTIVLTWGNTAIGVDAGDTSVRLDNTA